MRSSLSPGDILAGRYRIERFLARGGMGEVYRVRDLDLDIPIALKTIRAEVAADPKSLRELKQEVLLARSVSHPNVCRIYDLGRDDAKSVSFLTMEYLSGETLASHIREKGPLNPGDALPLVRQLADGLDAAHRVGIIHRDFKSANVMLVPSPAGNRAVIMDFGLATAAGSGLATAAGSGMATAASGGVEGDRAVTAPITDPGETISGASISRASTSEATISIEMHGLAGTPAYMSPELVQGERASVASDLYALGVVLYEVSTGRLPFEGASPIEILLAHVTNEAPAPGALVPMGADWERVILRLLSKDPRQRYPNATDVVLSLEGKSTTVEETRHFLPPERDAFVGRNEELVVLETHLEGKVPKARLLTILGVGGTGKTRLAVKYGRESLARWPGGVWFCDLTEARTADGIALAVATALNVPLGKGDPVVQLGHAIAGLRHSLLILDNFEQVAEHAEATLGKWLARAPETSFLVTSRERLRIPGETAYDLAPLDATTHGTDLFEARAMGHRAGFVVDDTNREIVREIVRLLDGMPLAIELAASRLRMLTLNQLRDRLGDRFRTLAGGERGRHATLEATMDWSWDLLDPWERSAVAQASICEGGFTLEAAEAVIDLSDWPEAPSTLDVVQSLVDKSWLRAAVALQAPRFSMYATVQEYASRRLDAAGSEAASSRELPARGRVEVRHGAYYATMGSAEAIDSYDRHGGVAKRALLRMEIDNLVAACTRAIARGDPDTAVATLDASFEVFRLRGPYSAIVELGQAVVKTAGIEAESRMRVSNVLGSALRLAGQVDLARKELEEGLAASRGVGNGSSEAALLRNLGNLHREQGRTDEARSCFEQSLAISREAGDRKSEGFLMGSLGVLLFEEARMDEARVHLESALAINREIGNHLNEGIVLVNLGCLEYVQMRYDEARRYFEEALASHREVGDRRSEGIALGNLGAIESEQHRFDEARRYFEEALAIHRAVGSRRDEGTILENLGSICREERRIDEALRYLEEALVISRHVGNRRAESSVLMHLGLLHLGRGDSDEGLSGPAHAEEAQHHFEMALAIHRELGDRKGEGIVLGHLGELHLEQGKVEDARRYIEEGLAILRVVGDPSGLAMLLCLRGEEERRRHDLPAARLSLAEAEAITRSGSEAAETDLGRAIVKLRKALESPDGAILNEGTEAS